MGETLDVDAMIQRFRERAQAVRNRSLPPVAGEERTRFIRQAEIDFQDFAIIGDAEGTLEDGVLTLRVDLRPPEARGTQKPES
jgi:limonene-1,2-epoxide hydrolase